MKLSVRLLALLAVSALLTPSVHAEIKARGSDSTLHVLKALVAAFEADSGKKVALDGGGSGAGAKAAIAGEVTLAFLSRDLNAAEKSAGLIGHAYAKDGVAIIVNQANPVAGLTAAELKEIYTGKTTTWPDGKPVRPVQPQLRLGHARSLSGTRSRQGGDVAQSRGEARRSDHRLRWRRFPPPLAYTSLGEVDETKVRILPIAGIKPSAATLKDGTYPISRTPTLATKGEPTGDEKAFIDFVLGAKGQAIVEKTGLVAVK